MVAVRPLTSQPISGIIFWLGVGLSLLGGPRVAHATFTDVTVAAGIQHPVYAPATPDLCVMASCDTDAIVGGAAVGDVNGDGWEDLYVAGATDPEHLYINQQDGTFVDEGTARGLAVDLYSTGGGFGDIDGDGDLDLVVLTLGEDRLYLYVNDGTGNFTEEAVLRGMALDEILLPTSSYSVTFGDIDRDGWIDMLVGEWSVWAHPSCDQTRTRLFHNLGQSAPGYFEDVTYKAGIVTGEPLTGKTFVFGPSFTDMDGDGWQDLVMASDFGTSAIFWNDGTGVFVDGTAPAGIDPEAMVYGMGSTLGDVDRDGDLDWFFTGIYDDRLAPDDRDGNRLYLNNGDRTFSDATDIWGVRDAAWGWGTLFWDCDNDADLDLLVTNGMQSASGAYSYHALTPFKSWVNTGQRMVDATTTHGLTDDRAGKGLLTFDYDKDGDLDVFVVNTNAQPALYRNDIENSNHWIRVRARGAGTNSEALGAKVQVLSPGLPALIREVGTAGHYMGQSERTLHFGLGPSDDPVDIIVQFSSGQIAVVSNAAVDTVIDVWEPVSTGTRPTAVFDQDEDCDDDGFADACILDPATDCDGNRVLDSCEITLPGADCDANGQLDACQTDCDADGVADACAILGGAIDCNSDGVPDSCEVRSPSLDCNGNEIPDSCDLEAGTAQDCDSNLRPDSCDLIANPERDCDSNGVLDLCEGQPDDDDDGVPNCADTCPSDPEKTEPGLCGCGVGDGDADDDLTPDCDDLCPNNPLLIEPGSCGCDTCFADPGRANASRQAPQEPQPQGCRSLPTGMCSSALLFVLRWRRRKRYTPQT